MASNKKDKNKKKTPARKAVVTTAAAPSPPVATTAPEKKARRERGESTPPKPVDDTLGKAIAARLVERGEEAEWRGGKLSFAGACSAALLVDDDGFGRSRFEWDGLAVAFKKGADPKQTVLSVANKLIRRADED